MAATSRIGEFVFWDSIWYY